VRKKRYYTFQLPNATKKSEKNNAACEEVASDVSVSGLHCRSLIDHPDVSLLSNFNTSSASIWLGDG